MSIWLGNARNPETWAGSPALGLNSVAVASVSPANRMRFSSHSRRGRLLRMRRRTVRSHQDRQAITMTRLHDGDVAQSLYLPTLFRLEQGPMARPGRLG